MLSPEQIQLIMPLCQKDKTVEFAPLLSLACKKFDILSARRLSAFIAQLAHESGELKYMEEIADGQQYEKRVDLGNIFDGDGKRFKGRGPIQITGRSNYQRCGKALGLDLISNPKLLSVPATGCQASAWFWFDKGLNTLADNDKFGRITKLINGGYNHLDERLMYWLTARKVFGL